MAKKVERYFSAYSKICVQGGEGMNEQVEAVQRMQDYIEKHIREKIDMAALAGEAGYSPWHARRLFIQYVGITPSNYIRKLRLRYSALRLRDEKPRIIDTAMDSGFESVDGFQRAFFNEYGCNPMEYENHTVPIPLFTPYGVKFRFLKRRTEKMASNHVFLQVVEKPARKAVIKRGMAATEYWSYCQEVGCDVWGILTSMKSLCGEPVCLWLPKEYVVPGTSTYVQGVEVEENYAGPVPEGFDVISLPAAKYLMFQGEPFAEEDFEQAISDIWEAEKKYDPAVIGYEWDHRNPKIQLEPIGKRGYIELLPIQPV